MKLVNFTYDTEDLQKALNEIESTAIVKIDRVLNSPTEKYHCYNMNLSPIGVIEFSDKFVRAFVPSEDFRGEVVLKSYNDSETSYTDKNWTAIFINAIKSINVFYNRHKDQLNQQCSELSKLEDKRCVHCRRAALCYLNYLQNFCSLDITDK